MMNKKILIDYDEVRKLFDEEFKDTMRLIQDGETHLDNLAEGFAEADRVLFKLLLKPPMTNGDRIRAMSDEDLAYWFEYSTICGHIQNSNPEWCETNGECRSCVLRWLKQPVGKS